MRHEDFSPVHLTAFPDPLATVAYGQELVRRGPAYTVIDDQNILLCGGIARDDSGQGWLWSFVKPGRFICLHGYVRRFIEVHPEPLIATADQSGPGCRWLEALGFRRTEPLAGFYPGCPDQFIYRRG